MGTKTQWIDKRSSKYLEEALYKRLFRKGGSEERVREELNSFLRSRKRVFKWEVGHTIRLLRSRNRFHPALKLTETMSKRGMNPTTSDHAIRLDLIAKAKGLAAAEEYFVNLSEPAKTHHTYGALLNCYCKELVTEKAESLMEKMEELNLLPGPMAYNSLMTLYTKTGQPQRVAGIIQKMKANNIIPDCFSYNVWMRSLAAANDISGVERVMEEMKRDGRVTGDWTTYSNLASIYANANLLQKAEEALQELEKRMTGRPLEAYQFLITLYGKTGNLAEVHRIWQSQKQVSRKMANISYLNMIQVLVKLKDLPGAEACFKEWESQCSTYDIRVANAILLGYIEEGKIAEAEALLKRAKERGNKPNARTWNIFMDYYLKAGEMPKVGNCVERAITCKHNREKWVPSEEVVQALITHYEEKSDVAGVERLFELLKTAQFQFDAAMYESLIRTYAAAKMKNPGLRQRLKIDGVTVSEEVEELLVKISGE